MEVDPHDWKFSQMEVNLPPVPAPAMWTPPSQDGGRGNHADLGLCPAQRFGVFLRLLNI